MGSGQSGCSGSPGSGRPLLPSDGVCAVRLTQPTWSPSLSLLSSPRGLLSFQGLPLSYLPSEQRRCFWSSPAFPPGHTQSDPSEKRVPRHEEEGRAPCGGTKSRKGQAKVASGLPPFPPSTRRRFSPWCRFRRQNVAGDGGDAMAPLGQGGGSLEGHHCPLLESWGSWQVSVTVTPKPGAAFFVCLFSPPAPEQGSSLPRLCPGTGPWGVRR